MGRNDDNQPPAPAAAAPVLSAEQFAQLLEVFRNNKTDPAPNQQGMIDSVNAMREMAEATRRSQRVSNVDHEHISPFAYDERCEFCKTQTRHPENGKIGHPPAKLKYRVFFCDGLQRADALTQLEIELFNSFTVSKTARKGKWKATLDVDGNAEVLKVDVPYIGMDVRADLPPLAQILYELLHGGEDAITPQNQVAAMMEMQRKIKELEAKLGEPVGAR